MKSIDLLSCYAGFSCTYVICNACWHDKKEIKAVSWMERTLALSVSQSVSESYSVSQSVRVNRSIITNSFVEIPLTSVLRFPGGATFHWLLTFRKCLGTNKYSQIKDYLIYNIGGCTIRSIGNLIWQPFKQRLSLQNSMLRLQVHYSCIHYVPLFNVFREDLNEVWGWQRGGSWSRFTHKF